jgi:hypothetical protein
MQLLQNLCQYNSRQYCAVDWVQNVTMTIDGVLYVKVGTSHNCCAQACCQRNTRQELVSFYGVCRDWDHHH